MKLEPKKQFPAKLYEMLELAHVHGGLGGGPCAVTWLFNGRAFKIVDEERFMAEIVPIFFKQTKIRSFKRQLHLWGFNR